MIYIALLRGINVGGKSIVSMAALKTCFEDLGFDDVKTYINSGNVLFRTDRVGQKNLADEIEAALQRSFKLSIRVLLKSQPQLAALLSEVPGGWINDAATKCDVMFLWPAIDKPEVTTKLPVNADIETVRYVPGAVLWHIDRGYASKSRMTRIIGTPLYAQMTVRNINTVRKLLSLANELA